MVENPLELLIEGLTQTEMKGWYEKQVLAARYILTGFRRLLRLSNSDKEQPLQLPDAEELVSETFHRVLSAHNHRYIWDGVSPDTFNKFFARAMRTTLQSLRSDVRRHLSGPIRLASKPDFFDLEAVEHPEYSRGQGQKTLAAAIAKTRVRGKLAEYASKLEVYAFQGASTKDIAIDLDIKLATVDTYRKRLRTIVRQKPKK